MAENLNFDDITIIFRHLKAIDLHRASMVCRSWYIGANYERSRRGPILFKEEGVESLDVATWEAKMMTNIESLSIMPVLQLQFFQKEIPVITNNSHDCICRYIRHNYYNISIGSIYIQKNTNIFNTLFVPNSSIDITTLSFLMNYNKQLIFCPEKQCSLDLDFKSSRILRSLFNRIFRTPSYRNSCMILLLDQSSAQYVANFLETLLGWFPNNTIPVWGGMGDSLKICSNMMNRPFCYRGMGWSFIFIKGCNMKSWVLTLGEECKTEEDIKQKFIDFKNNIQLRRHSIAFIYVPRFRLMEYENLETDIYKQTFPEIPIFYAGGTAGLGGNLEDFIQILKLFTKNQSKLMSLHLKTTIMILTY